MFQVLMLGNNVHFCTEQLVFSTYKGAKRGQMYCRGVWISLVLPEKSTNLLKVLDSFYTSNLNEKKGLLTKGWKDEGIGWYAPVSGGSPVIYRLYNPKKGFEEHHYTADQNEIRVLKSQNWNLEGPAWASASSDGVPVYRLFNKAARNSASSHHYTTDVNEKNVLSAGTWRYEGIAWYGVKQ